MKQNDMPLMTGEESALAGLCALYDRYGYARFRMSKFEEYDLYVRNKSFLLSDHMITFTDTSGKLMALKPDVTLSIVIFSLFGGRNILEWINTAISIMDW